VPYEVLQRTTGFGRSLEEARRYSANWSSYLASSAYAHAWLLPFLPHWTEVTFPGLVATVFGVAGILLVRSPRYREIVFVYGGLALLFCWLSFGPDAGLYAVLYHAVPLLVWLRVPGRFGLVVVFALSVLARTVRFTRSFGFAGLEKRRSFAASARTRLARSRVSFPSGSSA